MLVTKKLLVAIDFSSHIFFCVQQKKEIHTVLEHEGE